MLLLVGADDEFARHRRRCATRYELAVVTLPLSRARLYVTLKNYLDLVALRAREAERGRIGRALPLRARRADRDLARHLVGARHRQAARPHPREERATSPAPTPARSTSSRGSRSIRASATLRFMVSQNDSVKIDFSRVHASRRREVDRRARRDLAPADQHPRSVSARAADRIRGASARQEFDRDRLPDALDAHGADGQPARRGHRRHPAHQQAQRERRAPQLLRRRSTSTSGWCRSTSAARSCSTTLAAQAGISLENTLLVRGHPAAVRGLRQRVGDRDRIARSDHLGPFAARGHSSPSGWRRWSIARPGPITSQHFTDDDLKEIEYAALLHDFGKVGVREKVLVKAKKLYERRARHRCCSASTTSASRSRPTRARGKLELVLREGAAAAERRFAELDAEEQAAAGRSSTSSSPSSSSRTSRR